MLQRVTIDGINLPRLYIAENRGDADLAMSKGIPFIRWTRGQDELIRILLRPVLERMFPHIKWNSVLGKRKEFKTQVELVEGGVTFDEDEKVMPLPPEETEDAKDDTTDLSDMHAMDDEGIATEVADIAEDERLFAGGGGEMQAVHLMDIEDYVGDLSSCVDLEVLQRLRLMPAFIGDILDCIKLNIGSGMHWREGYNKRLGIPVGRFDAAGQLPNLIILDVSGSIPRGISATMISLIDTLRTQLSADLIITSDHSRFYPMGSELPDPQHIRDLFHYGNEAVEFYGILSTYVRGKHYGHVFSFGDDDTPADYKRGHHVEDPITEGTIVEHVHHYHTGYSWMKRSKLRTGYAKWCHSLATQPMEDYDTSWCKVIRD